MSIVSSAEIVFDILLAYDSVINVISLLALG